MATKSKSKESKFKTLFVDELKDIYWAEKHLVKALPKMIKGATSPKLVKAIEKHLEETKEQVKRIDQVFEILDMKAEAIKCEAMSGLVKEAESIMEETDADTMVRDAAIITASQKIEHYEIASYGTLVTFAKKMGMDDVADILSKTLDEEKKTDSSLTKLAVSEINEEAASE